MRNTRTHLQKLIVSALFLAIAYLLPFLTGQIPEVGSMLSPMHFPALLCGFLCGPLWGLAVGGIAPLFRSLTLGMPVLFPKAVAMAAELATYGAVAGALHRILPKKKGFVYISVVVAMLLGRAVYGGAMAVCLGLGGSGYTLSACLASAFTGAIPGIVLQLVLIPPLVMLLGRGRHLR
ncbi:MAG: ECF transporter S component [Clostridia bacterium]|nr:ECF transporter S component [Clostridia bacterium]